MATVRTKMRREPKLMMKMMDCVRRLANAPTEQVMHVVQADCNAENERRDVPGKADARRFQVAASAEFWRTWDVRNDLGEARNLVMHATKQASGLGEGGRAAQR